jgi:adenine deaminase
LDPENFLIPHEDGRARIIELIPGQILTALSYGETKKSREGKLAADLEADILFLAVVERHQATGNIGMGLVKGFGLKAGALATSVAHDSHNIIAVGTGHLNLYRAVNEVKEMGGGMVVVDNESVVARLPLQLGGLMSDQPLELLGEGLEELNRAAQGLNCAIREPFMTLSFLALPVIPELKLTDKGLVDVGAFEHVPLFVRENKVSEDYS